MDLETLIENVRDELGFPVTDRDLADRFGDTEVDLEDDDERGPAPLTDYIEPGKRTASSTETGGDGPSATRFDDEAEMRSYLYSKKG